MFSLSMVVPISAAIMLAVASPATLHSFPPSNGTVTVIVKESFPDTALEAIVVRSGGKASHDVIAIRRDALSADLLAATMNALVRARSRYGANPDGEVSIRIRHGQRLPPVPDGDRARINTVLTRLTLQRPQRVARIKGLVRILEIPLS